MYSFGSFPFIRNTNNRFPLLKFAQMFFSITLAFHLSTLQSEVLTTNHLFFPSTADRWQKCLYISSKKRSADLICLKA